MNGKALQFHEKDIEKIANVLNKAVDHADWIFKGDEECYKVLGIMNRFLDRKQVEIPKDQLVIEELQKRNLTRNDVYVIENINTYQVHRKVLDEKGEHLFTVPKANYMKLNA